jgi:DNA-binding protein H-NS
MSDLKTLFSQREALDKQITELQNRQRGDAIAKALSLIAEYGLTAQDLFGGAKGVKKEKVSGNATTKVAAKYRDPSTGKEWSGRGIPPKWISNSGKDKSDFLIAK